MGRRLTSTQPLSPGEDHDHCGVGFACFSTWGRAASFIRDRHCRNLHNPASARLGSSIPCGGRRKVRPGRWLWCGGDNRESCPSARGTRCWGWKPGCVGWEGTDHTGWVRFAGCDEDPYVPVFRVPFGRWWGRKTQDHRVKDFRRSDGDLGRAVDTTQRPRKAMPFTERTPCSSASLPAVGV